MIKYKWEVIKAFKGKSHKNGGIDISISNGRILVKKNNSLIKAEWGMMIKQEDDPTKRTKPYTISDSGNLLFSEEDFNKMFTKLGENSEYPSYKYNDWESLRTEYGDRFDSLKNSLGYMDWIDKEKYVENGIPFNFDSKYDKGLIQAPKYKGVDVLREDKDWKESYILSNTEPWKVYSNDIYKKSGYQIVETPQGISSSRLYIEPIANRVIDPINAKIWEYKNSDALIERLAGSYYSKDIDIEKWINEPDYRGKITRRYIDEEYESLESILNEIRGDEAVLEYKYEKPGAAEMMFGMPNKLKSINVQPAYHRLGYKDENEFDNALVKFSKEKAEKTGGDESEIYNRIKNTYIKNSSASQTVSHEQYHANFDKTKTIYNEWYRGTDDFSEKYDKIYADNNLIWRLNNSTKNLNPKDYIDNLGYWSQEGLDHIKSPEETKADIFSVRDYLRLKYDFEHINQQFDDKMFDKLMNDNEWKSTLIGKRMIERFGEDRKKWKIIMNLIVSSPVYGGRESKTA